MNQNPRCETRQKEKEGKTEREGKIAKEKKEIIVTQMRKA